MLHDTSPHIALWANKYNLIEIHVCVWGPNQNQEKKYVGYFECPWLHAYLQGTSSSWEEKRKYEFEIWK